jgi:pyrimidine operon attenuation protein/uracil phosphoribosyltransferase
MTTDALPDAEAALATLAERMQGAVAHDAALVGIYSGGAWVAERLAARLPGVHPLGFIDVSYYRDDYDIAGLKPNARRTTLPFDVAGATIVLVDDVLYTGRSVRAAINELFDFGRPDRIELAVLVDRGGRELPIAADFVGAKVEAAGTDDVQVRLKEDGAPEDGVVIKPRRGT